MKQGTLSIYSIYSPATLSSVLCDTQVFSPSGLSHSGRHPPAFMGTPSTARYPGDRKKVHLLKQ